MGLPKGVSVYVCVFVCSCSCCDVHPHIHTHAQAQARTHKHTITTTTTTTTTTTSLLSISTVASMLESTEMCTYSIRWHPLAPLHLYRASSHGILSHDIIEANCYIVDNSKLILMSIYVADLINNNRLQDVSATQSTLIRYHI